MGVGAYHFGEAALFSYSDDIEGRTAPFAITITTIIGILVFSSNRVHHAIVTALLSQLRSFLSIVSGLSSMCIEAYLSTLFPFE